ncbi:MAG: hypothetical protein M1166_07380 [Candidatus Thermoplasmatota archaeon]|nr:hypothetical protein [Candidatus Thermoplasmatota archaeon]
MYIDVKCAISNNRPQLAIIALFAYSEMIGGIWRIVHGEEENVVFGKGQSNKNFASYISMSGKKYSGINSREIYRIIRGGLVHRYLIRVLTANGNIYIWLCIAMQYTWVKYTQSGKHAIYFR